MSKNGNLLLSVPVRGDGTIDSDEENILSGLADWMRSGGEGIFGSQPWRVFGEGPTVVGTGMFGEQATKPFTAQDIRFTQMSGDLYAFVLGLPARPVVRIKSLAADGLSTVGRVDMLGGPQALSFTRDAHGLDITLPDSMPVGFVPAFRIAGEGLAQAR